MASKSNRKNISRISNNKGQAIVELVLISMLLLGAILLIVEGYQVFEKDGRQYLLTRELK